jgi:hypothetical protein
MTNPSADVRNQRNDVGPQKDMSLAPACLIVAVIGAVVLSVVMIGLVAIMGKGSNLAYAVREEIVPWIEQSPLSTIDQQSIVEQLKILASDMERDELTQRQMARVAVRLRESPVLQWGVVDQLARYERSSAGITDDEKTEYASQRDRWLRAAVDGKLSLQDMEFAVQNVATKDRRTGTLTMRDDVNDERLREFQRRVGTMLDRLKIPKEPFDKSIAQAFALGIEEALSQK